MRSGRLLFILLLTNGLLLPLSCLPALYLVNSVGMLPVFITEFQVENGTGSPIYVTPIGTTPVGKHLLPLYASSFPALRATRLGRLPVPVAEAITVRWDMDDIGFTDLVVEDGAGVIRRVIVKANPEPNYRVPESKHFRIDNLAGLQPVDPEVMAVLQRLPRQEARARRFYGLLVACAVPAASFAWLWRRYRRVNRTTAVSRSGAA